MNKLYPMAKKFTFVEKLNIAGYALASTIKDAALYYNIPYQTVATIVNRHKDDKDVLKRRDKILEKRQKGEDETLAVIEQINHVRLTEMKIALETAVENAKVINYSAAERILALIGEETNLDKIVRVYSASAEVFSPKNEVVEPKKLVNVFTQINNQILQELNAKSKD